VAIAVDVTNEPSSGSNQIAAVGRRPAPNSAPRSFSERLTTTASGRASRSRSASVGTRRRASELPVFPLTAPTPGALIWRVDWLTHNDPLRTWAFTASMVHPGNVERPRPDPD